MLVCPLVFKTSEGGEELPRWVRFPHIPAKKALREKRSAFSFRLFYFDGSTGIGQNPADDGAPRREGLQTLQQGLGIFLGQ